MRIVCQQTILMKYHALFVILKKQKKVANCLLLQIIGGALWVKIDKLLVVYKFLTLYNDINKNVAYISKM